jgi:hypothetical protein
MAILKRRAMPIRTRKWAAAAGVLALAYMAGCILNGERDGSEKDRGLAFDHRLHVEDQGLACADCHARWEDSEDPGMPRAAQCALCHGELDAEKPPERQVATMFDGGVFRTTGAGRQSDEIVFSHRLHATRTQDCNTCHAEVARDEGRLAHKGDGLRMSMDACIACHTSSSGPPEPDCSACHVEIRAGLAPPSHRANWTRYHGTLVRGRPLYRSDQCALCHEPTDCTNCHHIQLPESHNNYWRRRGHGLTASMDRDSCMTCHDSDSCQRCHEDTRPLSHTGSWGEPHDRHCLACHEPLRATSCGVCHADTHSHDQATQLPPDHTPSMNCRLCHGNGQPLPHEDNGQACTSCHQ